MHEVSLLRQAVEIAEERARAENATRIVCMRLRVGELSGVVPEALEFAFEAVAPGTMLEGGRLEVERVRIRCRCPVCANEFEPEGYLFLCPECGEPRTELLGGKELDLVELEVR